MIAQSRSPTEARRSRRVSRLLGPGNPGRTTELLVARYPSARVVMPGAGHLPWLQNRPAFAEEVVAFFDPGNAA